MQESAFVTLLAGWLLLAAPAHADVNVGITIGTPAPPPVVVTAPPQFITVPGTAVYHAPAAEFNLFMFSGRYYSFHNNVWFHATSPKGPWLLVPVERVPRPVIAVPVTYYKIPPGHAKKYASDVPPGHAKKHRDDDDGPGRGERGRGHR